MKSKTAATIPYSHQWVSERDKNRLIKVLDSDWITQGPIVKRFEERLARFCGAKYAVAVSSGTGGLHLACLALGVGPGHEVITSPNTFLATPNSVLLCGGKPVFSDIEPETFNLDVDGLPAKIQTKTKGIIPVHFGGHPCDMEKIHLLAGRGDLFVLEDACHALGARYRAGSRWYRVGSCAHSDACVFSFHPVKTITTGEGGAITTNRRDVYEKLLSLRSHGMVKEEDRFLNADLAFWQRNGHRTALPWYYEMQALGLNYRITDFQCALGMSQLERVQSFVRRRREIAHEYDRAFRESRALTLPSEKRGVESAYHLYVLRLRLERLSVGRAEIFAGLRLNGLGVQVHYIPVHLQPYYRERLGYRAGDFPQAENYYERAISIPLYPAMTSSQVREVISKTLAIVKRYEV